MRWVAGLGSALLGTFCVFGLLLAMNGIDRTPDAPPEKRATSLTVRPPPPKPKKARPRPRPKKKVRPKRSAPPTPMLASGVGGLDLGAFGRGGVDLRGATSDLLGDERVSMMTADAVDALPVATSTQAASYPSSARAKGLSGFVLLVLDIDESGRLLNVSVRSSEPEGVFDASAMSAVRKWRFQPGVYQGEPVTTTGVEQRLDFRMGS